MADRRFRTEESVAQEEVTRGLVTRFVAEQGCEVIDNRREQNGQTLVARLPGGENFTARVKLCWRNGHLGSRDGRQIRYSASQLMARVQGDDWVGTIALKMDRFAARGWTHLLIAQPDGGRIGLAALVPIADVVDIWVRQRDVSAALIEAGKLGRRKKNHAMNGHSPTLWLQDTAGGEAVADVLWNWPTVIDLTAGREGPKDFLLAEEVFTEAYTEGARKTVVINAYERDRRARQACIKAHGKQCAVCEMRFGDVYGPIAESHIHVHHHRPVSQAGGEYVVDPVRDLIPVCANCHAVIHLGGQCRTVEEVRSLIRDASDARREHQ